MKLILTLTLSFLISACASTPSSNGGPGLFSIPVDSIVTLNQPLTIPAGKVKAGVQFGNITYSVNQYEPHCEFQVNTILRKDATLPAGDYRITKVRRFEFPIAGGKQSDENMLASASETAAWNVAFAGGGSGAMDWLYSTALYLESDAYPDVRQLECGNAFPAGFIMYHHITIQEFEATAGDVMTIHTAGNNAVGK